MSHVGWADKPTAQYYLKIAQVLQPGGPSEVLSSHEDSLSDTGLRYSDANSFKNFILAFPPLVASNPLKHNVSSE